MDDRKIKVVWICGLSNAQVREKLKFSRFYFKHIVPRLMGRPLSLQKDKAVWNTNAAREFEKYEDIALTIIFFHKGIAGKVQRFNINGIDYVCIRPQDDYLFAVWKRKITGVEDWEYRKNRKIIKIIIKDIQPDIIHLIGAENPQYSLSLLDCPTNIPTVTSLQTLMSAPGFLENYPLSKAVYERRCDCEKAVIKRSDYLAQKAEAIRKVVKRDIKPDAVFLQMTLAVGVDIDTACTEEKKYDFVYFSNSVDKAADVAIEAFALVCKKKKDARLNISGSCPSGFRQMIDERIKELGITDNVFFTGAQETHEDVMKQVKRSKVAVLPLKVDLISGTIREAMAWGLPIVTTVTPATPQLNSDRESVLLSEKDDYQAMANNMLRVLEDKSLAEQLRNNAIITVGERYSNKAFTDIWRKGYYEILDNYYKGKPFSEDIVCEDI